MKRVIKASLSIAKLSDEQMERVDDIAERYTGSHPVSGNWDTEARHELSAIQRELKISREDAKDIMIHYLGFDEDDLI